MPPLPWMPGASAPFAPPSARHCSKGLWLWLNKNDSGTSLTSAAYSMVKSLSPSCYSRDTQTLERPQKPRSWVLKLWLAITRERIALEHLCPTQMVYRAKNYGTTLNQGHTLNDILMRAAHWMAYFDLSKLNLAWADVLKAFES